MESSTSNTANNGIQTQNLKSMRQVALTHSSLHCLVAWFTEPQGCRRRRDGDAGSPGRALQKSLGRQLSKRGQGLPPKASI